MAKVKLVLTSILYLETKKLVNIRKRIVSISLLFYEQSSSKPL